MLSYKPSVVELILTISFSIIGILMLAFPKAKIKSYVTEKSKKAREEAERAAAKALRLVGLVTLVSALLQPLLAPIVLVAGLALATAWALGKAEEGAEKEGLESPEEVVGEEIRPDPFFKLTFVASVAIALISLIPLAFLISTLPKEVVVHFGPDFKPNGWMPREGFVVMYALTVLSLAFMSSIISAMAYLKPELFFNKRALSAVLLLAEGVTAATFLYLLWYNAAR